MRTNTTIENLYRHAVQFIKFGFVGVLNNAISLVVYYVTVLFQPDFYLLGNVLGFVVSTLNAYFMNSRFVFRTGNAGRSNGKILLKTYAMYMISLGLSTGILYVLVEILSINEKIAPIFSLMVTVPFNFIVSKLWVYRKKG